MFGDVVLGCRDMRVSLFLRRKVGDPHIKVRGEEVRNVGSG